MLVEFSVYAAAVALIGLLFGSFLNVCIYRVPRDLSVVSPRSFCPECGSGIAWHDNIPILSYALLRGRCRHCRREIGIRYPLVEITTCALFLAVALRYGETLAAGKWMVFEALMVVLFWTDLEERLLPDEWTLGGTAVGLIFATIVTVSSPFGDLLLAQLRPLWRSLLNAGIGAALLAGPIWLVGRLYERIRKREGLGLGDVKLLLLMGAFFGLENGLLALLVGAVGGSVVGVAYVLLTRKDLSTYELPFGSFLCAGAAIIPLVEKIGLGG